MDSSESPVLYGGQEGAVYNGHFRSLCCHPLFLFNHFGDWRGWPAAVGERPQRRPLSGSP